MVRRLLVLMAVALCVVVPAASAKGPNPSPSGYDVSYPQCGKTLPSNPSFGIVGVNNGIVYSPNPCASTEIAWAQSTGVQAILYASTADPGPALSTHWPTGQQTPQVCDGTDSTACSYDYGYNAAADSYNDAVLAYQALGKTIPQNQWWLDVETANSWETNQANNVQALLGEVAFFQSKLLSVGIYANANDWQTITGNDTTDFSSLPAWHASATRQVSTATSYCGQKGPTGGAIQFSQYRTSTVDGDVRCF